MEADEAEDDVVYVDGRSEHHRELLAALEADEAASGGVEVVASRVVGALPDTSVARWVGADSVCCCASLTVLEPEPALFVAAGCCDNSLHIFSLEELQVAAVPLKQESIAGGADTAAVGSAAGVSSAAGIGSAAGAPPFRLVPRFTCTDSGDSVVDVGFSHDGRFLAAASYDGKVRIYERTGATFALKATLEGPTLDVEWVRWHPRGHAVAAGSKDATVWVWFVSEQPAVLAVLAGHSAPVAAGTFVQNGKSLVTADAGATLIQWDVKKSRAQHTVAPGEDGDERGVASAPPTFHSQPITAVAAHPALSAAATAGEDGRIFLVNTESGTVIGQLPGGHDDSVEALEFLDSSLASFTPGHFLLSGGLDGAVKLWETSQLRLVRSFAHNEVEADGGAGPSRTIVGGVTKVLWLLKDRVPFAVSAGTDCTIRVWDLRTTADATSHQHRILTGHTDAILCVCAAALGQNNFLFSGSDDNTLRAWLVKSNSQRRL